MESPENLETARKRIIKLAEDPALKPFLNEALAGLESAIERNNPSNYLLLKESKAHPELIVPLGRLVYGPEMEELAKELKLSLRNNAQGYIGNINFEQAEDLSRGLEGFMTTPSLFVEKLKLLLSGEAYDGSGNKHDPKKLEKAFKEITEVRNPWRAEWLGHRYSKQENQLQVTYNKFVDGKLTKVTEPLDEDTLMENRTPGISLESWIENPTSQGLPRKTVEKGSLYFWHPRDKSVAWFNANAGRSYLDCNWDAQNSNDEVGVAVVREKNSNKK